MTLLYNKDWKMAVQNRKPKYKNKNSNQFRIAKFCVRIATHVDAAQSMPLFILRRPLHQLRLHI